MRHVLSVVAGAALTVGASWALGRVLFARLGIRLRRNEQWLLEAFTGAALLSLLVFLLCAAGMARTEVFLVLGLAAPGLAWRDRKAQGEHGPAAGPRALRIAFGVAFAGYAVIYLSNSLAPEIRPDGVAYHLGLVARYFREHGFHRITTNMYSALSQGAEMLFLYAFAVGRHSAAATVHCSFLLASPWLLRSYGERIGRPVAGMCAGMLFYLSPMAGIDGVSAYNDVALAVSAFAMFYLLEIWREEQDDRLLLPVGLLAGFCFAIKFTGFGAGLYAMLVILFRGRWKAVFPVAGLAGLLGLPWLIKNWMWLGNPVSPFFNAYFPNPYIHLSFEKEYLAYFRNYGLTSFRSLPWLVTVGGDLGGLLGPLFLLTPVVFLNWKSKPGRWCLVAMVCMMLAYPGNIGARFLLPALPFAALGIAMALESLPVVPVVAIMLAAVLAWPRVIDSYRDPAGSWQIHSVPWKEALRLKDSDAFLFFRIPHILIAREMDEKVRDGGRVWSTSVTADAYTKRDVIVNQNSAEGQLIEDILMTAMDKGLHPSWNLRAAFPKQKISRLRLVQTAESKDDTWSIGEVRLFLGDKELERTPVWHATSKPNRWDAGLAIDRNAATRWRTWETIRPGMYWELDLGYEVEVDRMEVHCSHDQWKVTLQAQRCWASGCIALPGEIQKLEAPDAADLRRDATRAVQARGVGYLLVEYDHPLAKDIYPHPEAWGLRQLADRNRTRLYEIQ